MSLCGAAWEEVSVTERASVAGQHIVERVRGKVRYGPDFGQLSDTTVRESSSSPTTCLTFLMILLSLLVSLAL